MAPQPSVSLSALLVKGILALLTLLPSTIHACTLQPRQEGASGYNPFALGNNCTVSSQFAGYGLNHFSLVTANLTRALDFYTRAIGLVHLFTYTPENATFFSIAYLGHNSVIDDPRGSGEGGGAPLFETCEAYTAGKNSVKGLIELIYLANTTYTPLPATEVTNTFSHIGLVVPNTTEAQARFRALGVPILKEVGKLPGIEGPLANAYGLGRLSVLKLTEAEKEAIVNGLAPSGTANHVLIADPDGNVIEVQSIVAPQ